MSNSKIVKLTSENVQRLQAVEITPNGNVVVIAGKNGQGKTSVLDSIMYALGGAETFSQQPVRKGQEKAKVVVELDNLIITRTITSNGNSSLVVTSREGFRFSSPQSMLDAMVGKLSFDPLEFSRQKSSEQSDTLRRLAGLDFESQKQKRQIAFDSRTAVNRNIKSLENQVAAIMPPRAGLPEVEQSAASILEAQRVASEKNAANNQKRQQAGLLSNAVAQLEVEATENRNHGARLVTQIEELRKQLAAANQRANTIASEITQAKATFEAAEKEVAALVDEDLSKFKDQLDKVESANAEVRGAARRKELSASLTAENAKADKLTKEIEEIDKDIARTIKTAKYPIDGLSVDLEGTVLFNDLPLAQASSAEQLRVSVAIGLALNPKLRVLLVRDGSLLDEDSRALLLDLAKERDAQVWVEQVGTAGDVSVVIEDGMVKA